MTCGPTDIFAGVKRRGTVLVRQLAAEFGPDTYRGIGTYNT